MCSLIFSKQFTVFCSQVYVYSLVDIEIFLNCLLFYILIETFYLPWYEISHNNIIMLSVKISDGMPLVL
jgi:hypothetical protein